MFITTSVGEKHSKRFRVDTVLEKRGESELGMVPAPHSGLKREKERAVFLSHSVGLAAQEGMLLGWLTDFSTMVQCTLAFKITAGPEAVWCAQGPGALTALGSCLTLTSKGGRGTRHLKGQLQTARAVLQ